MPQIDTPLTAFTAPDALVAIMVAASVADLTPSTSELLSIARIVDFMPAFGDYDSDRIPAVSRTVYELFEEEEGLEALFGLIREALREDLYETAYALACDVVAADGLTKQSELRILEEIRYELSINRLSAAAIEHGARVRHRLP